MFEKLFAESGLSLDRLRAMIEVGAAGSIVRAAAGDPVRQSQYSRQIKELEEFFRIKLIERHGKGTQLTPNGKELARISRFFLRGLSNFQRGCLAEDQVYRIGASATVIEKFLVPVTTRLGLLRAATTYTFEISEGDDVERGLHDLTLDFGITTRSTLSRPLQLKLVGCRRVGLFVPKGAYASRAGVSKALRARELPLAIAAEGFDLETQRVLLELRPRMVCPDFLTARAALEGGRVAAVLPDFLVSSEEAKRLWRLDIPGTGSLGLCFHLAWNPRLLRLNPHVVRTRDLLVELLSAEMTGRGMK